MKVIVIGAGVVGVACAYELAVDGHEVIVVDRQEQPASETSHANAGLVSPGDSYAWASPEALKVFMKSMVQSGLGVGFRPRLLPAQWRWVVKFLGQCGNGAARRNTLRKFALTCYSRDRTNIVEEDTGIRYDSARRGILYFYRNMESLEHGVAHFRFLADQGFPIETVDSEGLKEKEPALGMSGASLAGGIYSPTDQTGDCHRFSRELASWCEREKGVDYRMSTHVEGLDTQAGEVRGVVTGNGMITGDIYVLAAGCDSPLLVHSCGIRLPVYPVKGYSITLPVVNPDRAPQCGGVDEDHLVAYSRLGDRLRLAGGAYVDGYDRSYKSHDFKALFKVVDDLFPGACDLDKADYWAGLRPMTPTSVPVHGKTELRNLYLNTGHGHVGWTMACGSARLLADLINGQEPDINMDGLLYAG